MKAKRLLVLSVVAVVGIVVAYRTIVKSVTTQEFVASDKPIVAPEAVNQPTLPLPEPVPEPSPAEQAPNISENIPPPEKPGGKQKVAPAPTQAKKPKEPLHDPGARVAMSLVGVDPEAEAYWLEAIFDSGLPENEREDLMEDLNEEGLSDHKRPGPQDLPMILNRLAIIEEILPHADEFMVTHLGEAYKDLVNLAEITQGGGTPVR